MKRLNLYQLVFTVFCFTLIYGCKIEDEPSYNCTYTIEKNKIISKYCDDFGVIIAAYNDQVLISSQGTICIFKFDGQNIELIQTIYTDQNSWIASMIVDNSTLAFGLTQVYGTSKVFIYERIVDSWEFKQEISIGRVWDFFGCDIDIDGDFMVIGAKYCSFPDRYEGRAYIYHKTAQGWIREHEFLAEQPEPGDWFGSTVAIYNDIVIVGSPRIWMHIYKFNETWALLRTDTILVSAISHIDSSFMVYSGHFDLRSFIIEPDSDFNYHSINFESDSRDIPGSGEIIEIRDGFALADMEISDCCYLLKYDNNQWTKEMVFKSDAGESVDFNGLAITDEYVILGGGDINNSDYSYVYFRKYQ